LLCFLKTAKVGDYQQKSAVGQILVEEITQLLPNSGVEVGNE
jgi:hypothetical protein